MQDKKNFKKRLILIGNRVRELRQQKNLTIQELSKNSGITLNYLKKIENGQAARINTRHFNRLCKGLNLSSLNELLYFY